MENLKAPSTPLFHSHPFGWDNKIVMRKTQLSWLPLGLISLLFSALPVMADGTGALGNELLKRTTGRTEGGIDVPILRRQKSKLQRRDGQAVSVGIGDYQDVYVHSRLPLQVSPNVVAGLTTYS